MSEKFNNAPNRGHHYSKLTELELEKLAQSLVDRGLASRGILERSFMNANRNRGPRLAYVTSTERQYR